MHEATDPFLSNVKEHLHRTLRLLDDKQLTNPVLIITRWRVDLRDVERLEELRHLRVTILVTWSGILDTRIEPVDSDIAGASLRTLARHSARTRRILYWRPVVAGLNDGEEYISRARKLAALADATVFTGLFYREEIRAHFRSIGVPDLYKEVARRKVMPRDVEARILAQFGSTPLFRKTSCGVAYVHGMADYNGHYGIQRICNICPRTQLRICGKAHRIPGRTTVLDLARSVGIPTASLEIDSGRILVEGSTEQQRYFLQHSLGFQVHDRAHPHLPGRHGRAEEGWE